MAMAVQSLFITFPNILLVPKLKCVERNSIILTLAIDNDNHMLKTQVNKITLLIFMMFIKI